MTQQIDLRLFGAFRQYGTGASIPVTVAETATVASLREALAQRLNDDNARSLLAASVFATDDAILGEQDPLPSAREICILPPVCGG